MRRAYALLLVAITLAGCTGGGSGSRDADTDGLPDALESAPRVISIGLLNGSIERSVTSDIHSADTDSDGLSDYDEYYRATDPRDVDTDRDGLLDGANVTLEPDSDAAKAWRAAGVLESAPGHFLGEQAFCDGKLKPAIASSDLPVPDGLGDGRELSGWNIHVRGATRHVQSDLCSSDADADGLRDDAELAAGTDPTSRDTDGDGAVDAVDADPLWDLGFGVANVTVSTANASGRFIVEVGLGLANARLQLPDERTAVLDVDDSSTTRGALSVGVIVRVLDAQGGSVAATPDPRGAVLAFDLLGGNWTDGDGARQHATRVELHGADGTLSFDWAPVRR